ncbi:MAG: hypothetical protein FJ293_04175, partial [Planctomycetes bacterium]|nr:hypothetical protein [Planctomycetota bacterium]
MVPSSPSRSLLLALLLPAIALVAWATWRARAAEQAAIDRARAEDAAWLAVGGADSSAVDRAATPTGRGELLRLELALAVPAGTALPALALRLRARDGA